LLGNRCQVPLRFGVHRLCLVTEKGGVLPVNRYRNRVVGVFLFRTIAVDCLLDSNVSCKMNEMVTDGPPRRRNLRFFVESDRLNTLPLPEDDRLPRIAAAIEAAMKAGETQEVGRASEEFLDTAADFFQVGRCDVRVLAARPLRVREYSTTELFGDYQPSNALIRVWTRTAVRKEITSFGTFLSTLCHEFCHHLDFQRFGFRDSWHTRGFYERTAVLYHHSKRTPRKALVWMPVRGQRWRIDWSRTNRARSF